MADWIGCLRSIAQPLRVGFMGMRGTMSSSAKYLCLQGEGAWQP